MIRLTDVIGKQVVSEMGWTFGRAFDVRVELGDGKPKVVALIVGKAGLRERLSGEQSRPDATRLPHAVVPWEVVVAIEPKRIVVKDVAPGRTGGKEVS